MKIFTPLNRLHMVRRLVSVLECLGGMLLCVAEYVCISVPACESIIESSYNKTNSGVRACVCSIPLATYKISNVLKAPCINLGINLFAVSAGPSCVV